jgi:uncharacterized membrane protein
MVINAKNPGPARPVLAHTESRLQIFALVGAVLTVGSGLYQLSLWGLELFRHSHWMHTKLLLVIFLAGLHAMLWSVHRKWQRQGPDAPLSRGLASALHGIAGLLLIAILGLVFVGRLPR